MTKVYPTPPRPVETPDGTDGPPSTGARPPRLPVEPWMDRWSAGPGRSGAPESTPHGGNGAVRTVETTFSHFQTLSDTCGSTFSPRGPPRAVPIRLWHSTPDGVNHAELCDGHVEIHGPKRIKYGGSLRGGPDVSWGGLSNLPSGHSRRGIPCPRRPRPGEKPSGVSAFVGVKGEDIRTLRARRPEASAVCRKAPGPRPHPVPVSHTQLHAIHMESTYVATCSPRTWIHVDPMAFNVEG
jgi:hypothetical protein